MFAEAGGMKNARKFIKEKNKKRQGFFELAPGNRTF
jgi:hypothetical protein